MELCILSLELHRIEFSLKKIILIINGILLAINNHLYRFYLRSKRGKEEVVQ